MNAVTDLAARFKDGVIFLTWHHRLSGAAVSGYVIYRFKQALAESGCQGCPQLFEKMETLPLDPEAAATKHQLTWSQPAVGGYHYIFKVVPVQSSGAYGPDSNLVKVDAIP